MSRPPRIEPNGEGAFDVDIPRDQRGVLRALPAQLREILSAREPEPDPARRRLFPPGYEGDPERSAAFAELVHDDLLAKRLSSADLMERTIDAKQLTLEELEAWLGAINDLRLVLGTRLEVTEETAVPDLPEDDPRAQMFALYGYLTLLEEEIVSALSGA